MLSGYAFREVRLVNVSGQYTPNYGQMGTEVLPSGNGAALPYGLGDRTSAQAAMPLNSMQSSGQDSATSNIGYRPTSGRADRLSANIVGGTDFDNLASGGYSGGATQRM